MGYAHERARVHVPRLASLVLTARFVRSWATPRACAAPRAAHFDSIVDRSLRSLMGYAHERARPHGPRISILLLIARFARSWMNDAEQLLDQLRRLDALGLGVKV